MGERLQYIVAATQYHYVDVERLRLSYLMKKAYERSCSMLRVSDNVDPQAPIPAYMIRKALQYGATALLSVSQRRRRHYLVRVSAVLGEIRGFVARRRQMTESSPGAPRR